MDVQTIIILNFFGFSSMTILTYTYLQRHQTEVLKEHFKAQVLFTIAFLFFSLIGIVPSAITQIVGNFGVLMGGGFELYAFMRLTNRAPRFERRAVFGALGAVWVISVLLSAFGDQSNLRIALITLSLALMWGWTAYFLLSNRKRSQLRTLIGLFYVFFVITMLLRAFDALDFSRIYTINTVSYGQTFTFIGIFFYMINGGSGTLLLIKEEDDVVLTRYATVDGLTDLFNRRYFVQEVVRSVALCKRKNFEFSMLIIDIDQSGRGSAW
jgi:predicted signal transduction protein with EAL and GGDEF domain